MTELQDRSERLRKARVAAPRLREICASATHVTVHLQFLSEGVPLHAEQSFVLYPAARAFFGFPCPYGDCVGIYDLSAVAEPILKCVETQTTGTLECSGARSRHRTPRQCCGLQATYTVTAEHGRMIFSLSESER
jgi:hypothetical protein